MDTIFFSIVVFILVALLLTCLILLVISLRQKPVLDRHKLPACHPVDLLTAKERTMLRDLAGICEKHGAQVYPQVSLGMVLRPAPASKDADEWTSLLKGFCCDFVLCDLETGKTKLVVMQGESTTTLRQEQLDLVEKTCEQAGIPTLLVRDYNIPGLEKAIVQKWARETLKRPTRPERAAAS